ncbi:MAG: histidinol-phosphate transaminase [Gammaproteobacteria bacterium]|nr:histidinol-phosphate transaminase [Gammaproteobacteria bacterium]
MSDNKKRINKLIRPEILGLSAYHVADASGLVKLDAMENPYGWSDEMTRDWLIRLKSVELNRYPDPEAKKLVKALRSDIGLSANMELMLGNGSDELIQIILMSVAGSDRVVLAPAPTFVMYDMIARFTGMQYISVPLKEDFSLNRDDMLVAIKQHQPAVVFLAWPNNPTGNLFDKNDVEAIIEAAPGLVVIDEAYHAFCGESFVSRLNHFDNLLVMRTLSKTGLAGLRLGMLMGAPEWIAEFNKVRLPYNINVLSQVSAEFALEHTDLLETQALAIREERETMLQQLQSMNGLSVFPSKANFILFRTPEGKADGIHQVLKESGVLIKNMNGSNPVLKDCLRVTVGKPEENKRFMDSLHKAL